MQSHHIIAAFSDLKSEIRTKYRPAFEQSQLKLWFTFEHDVLYVQDFANHKKCIALAIYNSKFCEWKVMFTQRHYGNKLIYYVIGFDKRPKLVLEDFFKLYKSYGFYPL
jgi:hypothetical protein